MKKMKRLRLSTEKKNLLKLCLFGVIFVVSLYGNWIVKEGGILDDSIMDQNDFFVQSDKEVRRYYEDGLHTGGQVAVVIKFDRGLAHGLRRIKEITDDLIAVFPEFAILSLSNYTNYLTDDGQNDFYLNPELHQLIVDYEDELAKNFGPYILMTYGLKKEMDRRVEDFKSNLVKQKFNEDVYGVLLAKDFSYGVITILMTNDYDEIMVRHRLAEFLEERKINKLAWIIGMKKDIEPTPKYEDVYLAGWPISRALMSAGLVVSILTLSTFGLIATTGVAMLTLRSVWQGIITIVTINFGIIFTRGFIGILQLIGFSVYVRVYILMVFTSVIIAGISFVVRFFETFNANKEIYVESSFESLIKRTLADVRLKYNIVALIAITNFLSLYYIGVRGIWEVGLQSAIGIAFLMLLVRHFTPEAFALAKKYFPNADEAWEGKASERWNNLLQAVMNKCYVVAAKPKAVRNATIQVALVFLIAISMIAHDYIKRNERGFKFIQVKTDPLEYIHGTIAYKAADILNSPSGCGMARAPIAVFPRSGTIYNPEYLKSLDRFSKDLTDSVPGVRYAISVLNPIKRISEKRFGVEYPRNEQQTYDILEDIRFDQGDAIANQLWFVNQETGAMVIMAFLPATGSQDQEEYAFNLLRLADKPEYKDLVIKPFDRYYFYARTDKYIREGKPVNVITSFPIVIVICALFIMIVNKKSIAKKTYGLYNFSKTSGLREFNTLYAWRGGTVMSIPFLYATSVIVLVMALFRVPLDQATACISALAVNAAVDFNVYLVADYQRALLMGKTPIRALRFALKENGRTILIDAILNAICFAFLMASPFIPIFRMGWVMVVMILSCAYGALVIMPPYLKYCVKEL